LHTHCFDAAQTTPYLNVSSAEKQSGKSTLLDALKLLVAKPWKTGRVTAAALYRMIDHRQPTLLFDETDATFGGDKEFAEALRGVLNQGHTIGTPVSVVVPQGDNFVTKDLNVFCPKAFAGIGNRLPDTVADRSIPIRLMRKSRWEGLERFTRRVVAPLGAELQSEIEAWAASGIIDTLSVAVPKLPEELSDRQQDGAEPLLPIADLIGEPWTTKFRHALVEVCAAGNVANYSNGTQLLEDIQGIFEERGVDRISSMGLVTALCEIETSPWGEWKKGRPITTMGVAYILKEYGVTPHNVRIGELVLKGYDRADMEDAFGRYLSHSPSPAPTQAATPLQTGLTSTKQLGYPCSDLPKVDGLVAGPKREIANVYAACSDVAAKTPPTGGIGGGETSLDDIWPTSPRDRPPRKRSRPGASVTSAGTDSKPPLVTRRISPRAAA
jgi:hypothetical protein